VLFHEYAVILHDGLFSEIQPTNLTFLPLFYKGNPIGGRGLYTQMVEAVSKPVRWKSVRGTVPQTFLHPAHMQARWILLVVPVMVENGTSTVIGKGLRVKK